MHILQKLWPTFFLKFQILHGNAYNIHRKAISEASSRRKNPRNLFFFFSYVEYERILLSAEAKAFSTMQLQFITSIHYLLNAYSNIGR